MLPANCGWQSKIRLSIWSDLKEVKKEEAGESLLIKKITKRLAGSLDDINAASKNTKERLLGIQKYPYFQRINDRFISPPYDIWLKLEQYTTRLEDMSNNAQNSSSAATSLWLPVEATAAKSGTLGKNYGTALDELNKILSAKSDKLRQTHFSANAFMYRYCVIGVGLNLYSIATVPCKINQSFAQGTQKTRCTSAL